MEEQAYLEELIANARAAQKEFAKLSQEDVDRAVKAMGKAEIGSWSRPWSRSDDTGVGLDKVSLASLSGSVPASLTGSHKI